MSLLYFVVIPLLASFLAPFFKGYLKYVSVIINILLLAFALSFIGKLPITEYISFDSPLSISFVLDSASLFFVVLFTSIMTLFSIYNINAKSRRDVFILSNMLLASVCGLVLSGDIFNIYIFFEIASITAYIMTSLQKDKQAYSGAIRYMIMGSVASVFLLIAIMTIYLNIGTLNLVTIGERFTSIDTPIKSLILISLFIGFGIKAEIFPLNLWVADIYQASSDKANALFSSVLSKSYIFVFFHIAYILKVDIKILGFLTIIGIISFGVAEISALSSQNLKRVFSYSTLGQIGFLFIGLSSSSQTAVQGAIFLIVMHAITKFMIFLSLDILQEQFNSSKIEVFGKFKSLFLFTIFAVGFLSLLGLPPFGGFIAKLTILVGLSSASEYLLIGAILIISLVEAVYLFRLLSMNRSSEQKQSLDIPLHKKFILSIIALTILLLGIFPQSLLQISNVVASTLTGVPHV